MTYKALVCLFLEGGNDSFNLVAPRDPAGHAVYAAARSQLAVPRLDLLPISPISGGDNRQWGFHPMTAGLRNLFEEGQLSVIANVGPLLQPTTKPQYLNQAVPLPAQLFSHTDQTTLWQAPSALGNTPYGWGGRIADSVRAMNGSSLLAPAISIVGESHLMLGQDVGPYSMSTEGTTSVYGTWGGAGAWRLQALQQVLANPQTHVMQSHVANVLQESIQIDALVRTAVAAAPSLTTLFPDTFLGKQLRMVARVIAARQGLGLERQLFFVRQSGYDTHLSQDTSQPVLLADLNAALTAFQSVMKSLGTSANVTTCTMSEFGRSLSSNGRGSDHGWGGHQLVLGGAVRGKRIYGAMPDLQLGGPDDAGQGRMIPTTAVEQLASTLARWFGVRDADMPSLFPRLGQFPTGSLGFMSS